MGRRGPVTLLASDLPLAGVSTVGAVKVAAVATSNLVLGGDGSLSAPVATSSALGVVSAGAGLAITGQGALSANVLSVAGRTGAVVLSVSDVSGAAPLNAPVFTGNAQAVTQAVGDFGNNIATTAFVTNLALGGSSVALAGAGVTLTPAQYGVNTIKLTGTLTANVTVTLPTFGNWDVYNTCTMGGFTINLSNGVGAAVSIATQGVYAVISDATAGILQPGIPVGSAVTSFNSRTGAVTLLASDLPLATSSVVGAVSAGAGLTVNGSGVLSANVTTVAGRTGAVVLAVSDVSGAAPLASPTFTGTVTAAALTVSGATALNGGATATTPTVGDNSTKVPTTAFVNTAIANAAGIFAARTSTSATTAVTSSDMYVGINVGAAATVNLPSGATLSNGKTIIIKDESGTAGANNITVTANGTDRIDSQVSVAISANNGALRLIWTGSRWSVV